MSIHEQVLLHNCKNKIQINRLDLPKHVFKIRQRFRLRKKYRKLLISSVLAHDGDKRPFAKVNICNVDIFGLLDSGANVSVFGRNCEEFIKRNNLKIKKICSSIATANGDRQKILGFCTLPVNYKGISRELVFYFAPSLQQELYLGINFWNAFAIAPDIMPQVLELEVDQKESNLHDLSSEQRFELEKVIRSFPSYSKQGLGCTPLLEHHIDTGDAVPVKAKLYPLSPPKQAEAYKELDRLLSLNVIEESNSPWCSPVVIVRKPGKVRLCIDSRKLNAVTKKDSYPLPHIQGLLSRLKDTHYISGIDLKDAFFQIKLSESSKEKTAFAIPGRPLYHFKVMPFGLCNGPQTMSRLMDRVIPARLREQVFIYLDDLLVCGSDFETHLQLLREVSDCLRAANLTINVEKSKFCQREIKYLGYRVGNGSLKTDPDKVDAIRNFPLPKSPKQVRRFIGMANWYRQFIHNFSELSAPITDCLRKSKTPFALTREAEEAFKLLKEALCSAPVLSEPDFSREFIIQCDASRVGVGGVLYQVDDNGKERPISFVSQKLNKHQQNYTVTEIECLAVVVSVEKFRPYIEGLPFRIVTDHSSLKWLMSMKNLNGRLARWSLQLQRYDFKIEHRKGSLNIVPDTLSRFDVDEVLAGDIDLSDPSFEGDEYRALKDHVSENQDSLPDVCISDGFVYKRVHFRSIEQDEEGALWKLWLPGALRDRVMESAHYSNLTCHGGYAKTLSRIRDKYFWPSMAKDVKRMVSNCEVCKSVKSPNYILRPPMGQAFRTERPFQRLFCDFLGPYTCSKAKNSYIFIVLDHLTKYIFLKPMRAATSQGVIQYFQSEIFPSFGVPQFLHSDNGKQFISREMEQFLGSYGIQHIRTGFYSPQSNASERANREILTKLRCYLHDKKDHFDWDKHIPQVLSILRSDFHSVLGCSPYYATFGQNMCQHASSYPIWEKLQCLTNDYVDILTRADKLHRIREQIIQGLDNAHDKAEKNYNKRVRNVTYQVGQEIFRRNFAPTKFERGINSKFLPKFVKGRVRQKIGKALYDIEDLQGRYVGRFHASDLRQ